jgi:hypothetical protein
MQPDRPSVSDVLKGVSPDDVGHEPFTRSALAAGNRLARSKAGGSVTELRALRAMVRCSCTSPDSAQST